jgi:hypothetical protein
MVHAWHVLHHTVVKVTLVFISLENLGIHFFGGRRSLDLAARIKISAPS